VRFDCGVLPPDALDGITLQKDELSDIVSPNHHWRASCAQWAGPAPGRHGAGRQGPLYLEDGHRVT
jgi:hypothetical protein